MLSVADLPTLSSLFFAFAARMQREKPQSRVSANQSDQVNDSEQWTQRLVTSLSPFNKCRRASGVAERSEW